MKMYLTKAINKAQQKIDEQVNMVFYKTENEQGEVFIKARVLFEKNKEPYYNKFVAELKNNMPTEYGEFNITSKIVNNELEVKVEEF